MVYVNLNIESGGGLIHLFDPSEFESGDNEMSLTATAYCDFMFMESNQKIATASSAGSTMFSNQSFTPHDLADLVERLRQDGYMCRECVREYFQEVGGIAGLYHHPWTEDLHREDAEKAGEEEDLKPVHQVVEVDGITVMHVGDGATQLNGTCPRCESPVHVRTHVKVPPDTRRIGVACASCRWSKDVDMEWDEP